MARNVQSHAARPAAPPETPSPANPIEHLHAELAILRQCGLATPRLSGASRTGGADAEPDLTVLSALLDDARDPALCGLLVEAALREVEKHIETLANLVDQAPPSGQNAASEPTAAIRESDE